MTVLESHLDVRLLACPRCQAVLEAAGQELRCSGCGRRFPVVAGIPDLRLSYPDPYLSLEGDLERARELEARFEELDLLELLKEHWRRSGKPSELAERFLAGDRAAMGRSRAYLEAIEHHRGSPLGPGDRLLEVGCGTAALAAVAAERAGEVWASDISMRWLVLAKKRLLEAGVEGVRLVCTDAQEPGFASGTFSVVAASDVVEHAADQERFTSGCSRMLSPGGCLFLATPNRFSLGLEPHVRLWGVGFLPRRLAGRYTVAVRKAPYDHVRLLSSRALRKLLERNGLAVTVVPPEIPAATEDMYSGLERSLVRLYNRARRVSAIRRSLLAVGPFFHVFGTKGAT
jgi:2-polyprenyl-3-methyl-5-hydroxy-6-metoxy-1,4-benzoquinol methylase